MRVRQGHRTMTLEHLLLALTEDEEAALVLMGCSVDLIRLRDDIAGYLGQLNDRAPPDSTSKPVIAPELKRIIEYAAAAAQQAKRSNVNGAITLAAMIGEGRSMAASFLRAQGFTFEVAVRVLQQQGKPQSAARGQSGVHRGHSVWRAGPYCRQSRTGRSRPQAGPNPLPRGMGQQTDPRPFGRSPPRSLVAERSPSIRDPGRRCAAAPDGCGIPRPTRPMKSVSMERKTVAEEDTKYPAGRRRHCRTCVPTQACSDHRQPTTTQSDAAAAAALDANGRHGAATRDRSAKRPAELGPVAAA